MAKSKSDFNNNEVDNNQEEGDKNTRNSLSLLLEKESNHSSASFKQIVSLVSIFK